MASQESHLQIDVTQADIHLANNNMSRPYIYVASDETRQILAAKIYDAATPQNFIDFIGHVVKETTHTESSTED